MSNKFFGQYLLEKGLLNPQQLLRAIELQREANPPLGQLAIREGFINDTAANQINTEQQRTDMRFGELAISMGHMSEEQIERLFHIQTEIKKFFGEIVVEQGFLTKERMGSELSAHADLKQASMINIDNRIKQHLYCQQITDTLEAIIKNFTRVPKIQVQIAQIDDVKPIPTSDCYIISQTMHVPRPIKVGWVMKRGLMQQVANRFLGIDVSHQEEIYVDAVSEFLNIILGNALVSNGEHQSHLEPPVVEYYNADYQAQYASCFSITMSAPQQDFGVFFIHG